MSASTLRMPRFGSELAITRLTRERCATCPVLLVEEQEEVRDLIGTMLAGLGFSTVDRASDGREAMRLLKERPYGLVIADCLMDPVSGLDLLCMVRADERLNRVPFLLMSGVLGAERLTVAKQAGASSVILKPFRPAALADKLNTILRAA